MAIVDFSSVALEVSDFVGLINQTIDYALPSVTIRGELANYRVSKNRWVYFDLQDETASVKFFATVYQLQGPLENGMMLRVTGSPRLHPLYGFSVNVTAIRPEGEGTIRRAAELLQAKLTAEGLFDPLRKRPLPYPPLRIGLVTSKESAAYADFTKILRARWPLCKIILADTQVQGQAAPEQISRAIARLNEMIVPPEVLVVTRGGGSADDLYAFSTEQVTRAVAASRIPTLVAIGHEIDSSLAELAADVRASTPSNAAELLVPDQVDVLRLLGTQRERLASMTKALVKSQLQQLTQHQEVMRLTMKSILERTTTNLMRQTQLLAALSPPGILARGYAIIRYQQHTIRTVDNLPVGGIVDIEVTDGHIGAKIIKDQ
jgi:exodeoxyribonuclease VII large subunit